MVAPTVRLPSSFLPRPALHRALAKPRPVARAPASVPAPFVASRPLVRAQFPSASPFAVRGYASGGGLSHQEIQNRILNILKSFEKVDPAKVNAEATFTGNLGLDSLDAVEVVMAIEEEFNVEIPDIDADAIQTVGQAIEYISKTPAVQ